MVGKNGRKVLKTKGFRHGRENGLNISKRFFSLHGLTSALRLRGFSSDLRAIALHRACRWGKNGLEGLYFWLCTRFMVGLMGLLYDGKNGCVAVFLCLFSNMMP